MQEIEAAELQPLPDERLIERRRQAALDLAVERLPEPFRTPLLLYAAGHSYERIMEITRTAEGTVKSRICGGSPYCGGDYKAYL